MGQIQTMNQRTDTDTGKGREKEVTVIGPLEVARREVGVDTGTVVVEGNEEGSKENPNQTGETGQEQEELRIEPEQAVKEGTPERRESLHSKRIWLHRPWRKEQEHKRQREEDQERRRMQGSRWMYWRNQEWRMERSNWKSYKRESG